MRSLTVHDFEGISQLALEIRKEGRTPGGNLFLALQTHPVELVDDPGAVPLHLVRGQALVVGAFLFLGDEVVLLEPLAQVALSAGRQQRFDGGLEEVHNAANTRHDGLHKTNIYVRDMNIIIGAE